MADRVAKLELAQKAYDLGKDLSWNKGDFDAALVELQKSLDIRQGVWGQFHDETSKSLYEIGRAQFAKKLYTDSLVSYRKCLRIRVTLYGKFHTETKNADHCVRRKAGRNAEAQLEYIKAASIEEYFFGKTGEILGEINRKAGIKPPPAPQS